MPSDSNNIASALLPWAFALGAIVSIFFCFLYTGASKMKEAVLMAALFFLCVGLGYLPHLETIKAFSIELRLQGKLDRAEDILASMKRLSFVASKSGLYAIANMGRFGALYSDERQRLVNGIITQMDEAGLTLDQKRDAAQAWLDDLGGDLLSIVTRTLQDYVAQSATITQAKKIEISKSLNNLYQDVAPTFIDSPEMLARLIDQAIALVPLDLETSSRMQRLKADAEKLNEEAWSRVYYVAGINDFMSREQSPSLKNLKEHYP